MNVFLISLTQSIMRVNISKLLFLLCFNTLLFNYSGVIAQNFNGGFFGGMTASEVSGDNLSGPNKLGFNAGIYTNLKINDHSAIEMEIMYIQKGSKRNPTLISTYQYRLQLDYVEIPVLYKFSFAKFDKVQYLGKIKYEAGVSYSRLMRYKEEVNYRLVLPGEMPDYYYNEANLILGFYYPISEKLDFNFRSSNSITPIRPHASGATTWYNWGQYHTHWSLNLNYKF